MATALITGSARGIGAAVALRLAKDGYNIALNDISEAMFENNTIIEDIKALGVECEKFICDVSSFEQVEKTVKEIKERFGSIDVLVNNAGITRDGLMARMSDEMSKSMGSLKGESYIFAQGFLEYTPFDDTNISLETFMQELPDQEFTFYLNYVPEDGETAEDIYDGVSSMVSSIAAAKGNVAVYICDEKTLGKIQGYVESHDILYDSYNKIVEGKYAGKIQYAGGRPVSDKNEFLKKAGELL
jgi:NAD(P)-dependent dehydrogenase (short-subunit alcohol dehydrogenase family)